MSQLQTNFENMETIEHFSKKTKMRSKAYPAITLEEALDLVRKLRNQLGRGPHERSDAAIGLGYKGISGASGRKIAAITHYGLLDRSGDSYTVSELAERILFKKSEEDEMRAIIEAAQRPHLYREILSKYSGEQLPTMLSNILYREHDINPNFAQEAAEVFRETMKYAKLLNEDDIVLNGFENTETTRGRYEDVQENDLNKSFDKKTNEVFSNTQTLQGSGWRIVVDTKFELTRGIKKALRALEDSIDDYIEESE